MLTRILAATATSAALAISFVPSALSQTFTSKQYMQTNLVGDLSGTGGTGAVTDPNLRDAWGLSRSSTGDWWISDNVTGLSTLYSGTTGAITPLVVAIPPADPKVSTVGSPTGTIFNGTTGFPVTSGKPAVFLFATQDGTLSGWNPTVNPTNAIITVKEKGSSFFGLTTAQVDYHGVSTTYLYAADFGKCRIAVYDTNFNHVTEIEKRIASIPVPKDFCHFNVQNLGGNLYVAVAKKGSDGNEEHANGLGIVAVLSPDGRLIQVFDSGLSLNAPWGLAIAPSDFGAYSHDVLVGSFGSGTISVFDSVTRQIQGQPRRQDRQSARHPRPLGAFGWQRRGARRPRNLGLLLCGPEQRAGRPLRLAQCSRQPLRQRPVSMIGNSLHSPATTQRRNA